MYKLELSPLPAAFGGYTLHTNVTASPKVATLLLDVMDNTKEVKFDDETGEVGIIVWPFIAAVKNL